MAPDSPNETVLFSGSSTTSAPIPTQPQPMPVQPSTVPVTPVFQPQPFAQPSAPVQPSPSFSAAPQTHVTVLPAAEPAAEYQPSPALVQMGVVAPPPVTQPTQAEFAPTAAPSTTTLSAAVEEPSDPDEFELDESKFAFGPDGAIYVHQPLVLLILRIVGISIAFWFIAWLGQTSITYMVEHFPELLPDFVASTFVGSTFFRIAFVIYLALVIGIFLVWRSIYFEISKKEVTVHSGIIIKQAKVLKRIGISIRGISFTHTLMGQIFKYVTINVGSELLGGISMTISDDQNTIDLLNATLKPGEVKETNKIF